MDEFLGTATSDSTWITVTPTSMTKSFPFYITEAGHFTVYSDYLVKRDFHDSFLLLYTCKGSGCVKSGDTTIELPEGHTVIIDCHMPHEYFSTTEAWEFMWIHFQGSAVKAMFEVLYPNAAVYAVNMEENFRKIIASTIGKIIKNDIKTCIDCSYYMHRIINLIYSTSLEAEESNQKKDFAEDIYSVVEYIKNNYAQPITIDDMIETIHISKYHFIRRFSRIMGMTPYNYLMNYRITMAKTLLRTTNKTVSEIAELCGFMDASNFIAKFKRSTNQKPLQYRRDFT